ncbi:MAG: hypothetical protein GXO96_01105 [Nitrospirae bacterium]|nr:hypothetical protein [Candidatus Manganitrophaceae bacterium]
MKQKWTIKTLFPLILLPIFAACSTLSGQSSTQEFSVIQGNVCEGSCQITLMDGSLYEGTFEGGIPHGEGTLMTVNGDRYVGDFANGLIHGEGVYSFSGGAKYTGDFRAGSFYGYGVLTRNNGDKYVGEFENNEFHGKGILSFVDSKGNVKTLAGEWNYGLLDEDTQVLSEPKDGDIVNPEVVLFYQYQLLSESMGHLAASRPGVTDLYLLAFGGDSHQDVFMNEALYTTALFETKFSMQNRTMYLINHPAIVNEVPIASVTNLRVALQFIATRMDIEEDILFLYLTSHGSKEHTLSVSLGGVPLGDLSAETLSEVIEESGIKWKVIAISACYSGGFIKHLKDDYTMVITSARSDRTSFGCSDDSEMTYFGRAFFQYAMDQTPTFVDAFSMAKEIVSGWEKESNFLHSEPQIHRAPLLEEKLKSWRRTVDQRLAVHQTTD